MNESMRRFVSDVPCPIKTAEREEIDRLTREFIRKGGRIKELGYMLESTPMNIVFGHDAKQMERSRKAVNARRQRGEI